MKKFFVLALMMVIAISASATTTGNEPAVSKYPSWPVASWPVTSWPQELSIVQQKFVGRWYPATVGWHGVMDITSDGNKLCVMMSTDEGDKRFEDVELNEAEPSLEWAYSEDIHDAVWYIGTWSETNRKEILANVNHFQATCGSPTEVYKEGIMTNHSKIHWKYHLTMVNDKLVISYGYKWDFFAPSGELAFTKANKYMSALTYRK